MVTLKGNNGTYEGTSEDNKPLNVPVNTEFNELDTGKTYYFDGEAWQEEPPCEGGGFTPTSAQLAAMNSGITEEDVTQIGVNENNILSITSALQDSIDNGVKNLLNVNLSNLKSLNSSNVTWVNNVATSTDGHITITFNADNTLTVYSDGNNAQLEFRLTTYDNSPLPNGALVLSGCPDTGSLLTYDLRTIISTSPTTYIINYSGGTDFEYAGNIYTISIVIRAGQTINKVFCPMICEKTLYDVSPTYQPYAMSNAEITAWILAHS